jgi:hypothetical protein
VGQHGKKLPKNDGRAQKQQEVGHRVQLIKDPTTEKILQLQQGAPNFFGIDGGIEMGRSINMIDSNLGLNGKNS